MAVVILGGGIIGLTMANLLAANADLQIVLLEPHFPDFTAEDKTYDIRCSAITRASQDVFMRLGVWQEISQQRIGVYDQIIVWEQPQQARVHFSAAAISQPNLGHIVENRTIARSLYNKLRIAANVKIIPATAKRIEAFVEFNRVFIDDYYIDCKLLIGADGKNSWLRNNLNIPSYTWGHGHCAIVAVIKTQLTHNNTAWQRFTPTGPIAFLPLDDANLCSLVWANNENTVQQLMELSATDFSEHLAKNFNFILGSVELAGKRASFPVNMLHASTYIQGRSVLIGDAAHALHPLAGQGLNLGIVDALNLATIINQAHLQHTDADYYALLRKYERSRKVHNLGMLALVTSLKGVFAMKHISAIRNQGLQIINGSNWCKNKMMRFALGLQDD